jgi:hypothetical protein
MGFDFAFGTIVQFGPELTRNAFHLGHSGAHHVFVEMSMRPSCMNATCPFPCHVPHPPITSIWCARVASDAPHSSPHLLYISPSLYRLLLTHSPWPPPLLAGHKLTTSLICSSFVPTERDIAFSNL